MPSLVDNLQENINLEKMANTKNYNHNKHERNLHKSKRHGDGTETEVRQGKVGNKNIPA